MNRRPTCSLGRALLGPLLLAGITLAAQPAAAQRAGNYEISGTTPDGTGYQGVASLQPTGPGTWRMVWQVGGQPLEGVGISSGDSFSAAYVAGDRAGVILYQVLPNGILTGQWTTSGSGAIGTETLTPR